MITRLALLAFAVAAALAVAPEARAQDTADDVVGAWSAEEDYFRAVILIERGAGGALAAFFSDDGRARGAPLSGAEVRGDSLFLDAEAVGAAFRGAVSGDGSTIRGTWTQGAQSVPLTLTPVGAPARAATTDEPATNGPAPYPSEEVAFDSAPGVVLAGTLTVPEGAGPFPAVVLLQGSGLSDRDAEVGGHRTFEVLADHLTRSGVAVLRYDKRGGGRSTGDAGAVGLGDLAEDAEAAVRFVRGRSGVDPDRVGLVGHSEGALVAPVAAGPAEAAFLVLLMPPATPTGPALVEQNVELAAASGAPPPVVESVRSMMDRVVAAAGSDADSVAVAAEIRSAFADSGLSGDALDASVRAHTSLLFRDIARYDPGPALRAVEMPTLAVLGSLDLFVPDENEDALRASLGDRGTVHVAEGVNHWLQPATTGLPDEIARIEETVAPAVLSVITEWIVGQRLDGQ